MRMLDTIRRNPIATLAVVVAGLGGWAITELLSPPPPLKPAPMPDARALMAADVSFMPTTADSSTLLLALSKLRPGMSRVEVEELVGAPTADSVHPVTVTDGRARYRAAYDIGDPEPLATIRPIKRLPIKPMPRIPHESSGIQVALEYDASKPGHPLIEVLYLDPLF
jgi:hypothetical protein